MDEEKLVAVYVDTWRAVRGTPTGDFPLSIPSIPLCVPRNIHLSTSLVTRCVTTEMIRTCQNGETDSRHSSMASHHFNRWITRRSIPLKFPRYFDVRTKCMPDFPVSRYIWIHVYAYSKFKRVRYKQLNSSRKLARI